MLKRSLALLVGLACLAVAAPTALGVRVHVRVEGKTQTIYGSTEPTLDVQIKDPCCPPPNALTALETASLAGEFFYHTQEFPGLGSFVDQIGRYASTTNAFWLYKVNGADPGVGAGSVVLRDGDRVLWYWAQSGIVPGGPSTLRLRPYKKRCYQVSAQNDQGSAQPVAGAVLHVDGRSVKMPRGVACPGPHKGLVRATAPPAVRSNALR